MFCPAMLEAAMPRAWAGRLIKESNRCAAPNPPTTAPPKLVTTLMIAAEPPEMTAICRPAGMPRLRIVRVSTQVGSVGLRKEIGRASCRERGGGWGGDVEARGKQGGGGGVG